MCGELQNSLVGGFSLEDLDIPEEEKHLDEEQDRGDDSGGVPVVMLDHVPEVETGSDGEEDSGHQGVDTLELPDGEVEEVQDEENNVDHYDNKVKTGDESETSFREAGFSSIPTINKISSAKSNSIQNLR